VSIGLSGVADSSSSDSACISADGRYVAFVSGVSDLVAGDTNGKPDVFVRDLVSGATKLVCTDNNGNQLANFSEDPSISGDGRYVALCFGTAVIYVKDLSTGSLTRASTDGLGNPANGYSQRPSISADGRYVAFQSDATNLVANDTYGMIDIFVKDLWTGVIVRASTDSAGNEGNGASGNAQISSDGRYVTFERGATNLVANGHRGVFTKDLWPDVTTFASTKSNGYPGGGGDTDLSDDGRYVVFETIM